MNLHKLQKEHDPNYSGSDPTPDTKTHVRRVIWSVLTKVVEWFAIACLGFAVATIRYVGEFRMQQLSQDKQIEALIAADKRLETMHKEDAQKLKDEMEQRRLDILRTYEVSQKVTQDSLNRLSDAFEKLRDKIGR